MCEFECVRVCLYMFSLRKMDGVEERTGLRFVQTLIQDEGHLCVSICVFVHECVYI